MDIGSLMIFDIWFLSISCVYCIHKPWQGERIKTHNSNKNYKASQKNERFFYYQVLI